MSETDEILPIQRLVCAAAGRGQAWAVQVFALDNACANIARMAKEPIMAQIRLAWWRDGIAAQLLPPEHCSPEMEALRAAEGFADARDGLIAMIDGWEALILGEEGDGPDMLSAYSKGRGAGLFAALAPEYAERSALAGQVWGLWDLAGHVRDAALAEEAIALARSLIEGAGPVRLPRMLAMMGGVALADIRRGRGASPQLTPGLYARLLRLQIFGR